MRPDQASAAVAVAEQNHAARPELSDQGPLLHAVENGEPVRRQDHAVDDAREPRLVVLSLDDHGDVQPDHRAPPPAAGAAVWEQIRRSIGRYPAVPVFIARSAWAAASVRLASRSGDACDAAR